MYSASSYSSAPYSSSGGYRGQGPVVFFISGSTQLAVSAVATKRTEFSFSAGATLNFATAPRKKASFSLSGSTTLNAAGYALRRSTTAIPCSSVFTVAPNFTAHVLYRISTGTILSIKDTFNFPMWLYSNGKTKVTAKTGATARASFALNSGSVLSFKAKKLGSAAAMLVCGSSAAFVGSRKTGSTMSFGGGSQASFDATKRYSSDAAVHGGSTANFESGYTTAEVPKLDMSLPSIFVRTAVSERVVLE